MGVEDSFGQRVKARRRELGLTQEELAYRVGCAPVTLRKIEYDDLRPSVQIAERLAMGLIIPLEERAAFVRLARLERVPLVEPNATPTPRPEEIGTEDLSGRAIRGYALGERIGHGGMGAVYRAVQPLVEREVAVKIILPQYANHPEFIRRFEAEAQLVARLEHPHIVPLYDYWREPGVAYLVMRLLRGGSLHTLLQAGPLPVEAVTRVLEQVGAALAAAHRAGVIHRDLKPANVLLDEDGNAYLADFGIAKNLGNPLAEDQTQADAIVGSPAYISPEQIKSEFVRPQTDIYALGVMLYELLTGHVPFVGPTPIEIMHQHLTAPLPSLSAHRAGLPAALDAVIERATAKDQLVRYADVDGLMADFRAALAGLGAARIARPARTLSAEDNPYQGLRAFGESQAANFFGREALTQQLLARLGEGGDLARFLAVVGPSGSGKSSVVKAGLIPTLRNGGLPGSEHWFIVEMLPGPHPLEELEAALLRIAAHPPDSLLEQLRLDRRGLLRAVRRCLPEDPAVELVLVIDQFEEIFTLCDDEAVRAHFLDSLVTAVLDERSRLRVVLTLRADFIDRPLGYVDFGELLRQRLEVALPLTPDELERAITRPAERVGLELEPGLVTAILQDVAGQPGALPLLQFALTELFEKREGASLTRAAYRSINGVLGALARRAEEVFVHLDEAGRQAARQVFLRLVTVSEVAEDTRRRVRRAELNALTHTDERRLAGVVEAFGQSRLLAFDRDPVTRGPTVEVAHEALLREWERLRDWLSENRAEVRLQRQLAAAAEDWAAGNYDASFLLAGARLAQFEGWADAAQVALTVDERAFLDASLAERDRQIIEERERRQRELETAQQLAETERQRANEQAQAATRLRGRNRLIALAGALALILAIAAGLFSFQSNQNLGLAQAAQARSEAQRLAAEANNVIASNGDPQLAALLSLRSLKLRPTLEGDGALVRAAGFPLPIRQFVGHAGEILALAISPDGRYLLTGSRDHTARLWDVPTGQTVRQFIGHTADIWAVAFSPDGHTALTGADDGTARLWDVQTGQTRQVFTIHAESARGVAFSPDGQQVLTSNNKGITTQWDIQTGQSLQDYSGKPSNAGVAISADGRYILTGQGPAANLFETQTGRLIHQLIGHSDRINSVAFSPDGKYALTGSDDDTARLWEVQTGQEIRRFSGHASEVWSVAFSPDGKTIATASLDTTTRMWSVETGQLLHLFLGHTSFAGGVAFSPDGKYLITGGGDKTALLWEAVGRGETPQYVGHTGAINGLAFSPDGRRLLTGGSDATARVWDVQSGQQLRRLNLNEIINNGVAVSPDGRYALVGDWSSALQLWNLQTGQEIRQFEGAMAPVNGVAFSPDGRSVLAGLADQTARLWDLQTGQLKEIYRGHSGGVYGVAFSPDGKHLLTGSADGTARLWDAQTNQLERSFVGHTAGVNGVAFSPDGKLVATASTDQTARVWDTETGQPRLQLTGHTAEIWSVAFSPDGHTLLTASSDRTARLWDVQTGQELRRFVGHTSLVEWAAFSPDGRYIATASDDGTARLWNVNARATVDYLCAHLLRDLTPAERTHYNLADTLAACP